MLENGPGVARGGRYDVIRDPEKRTAFFDRVLNPLLEASPHYPNSIFARAPINEPEWVIGKFSLFGERWDPKYYVHYYAQGDCALPLHPQLNTLSHL